MHAGREASRLWATAARPSDDALSRARLGHLGEKGLSGIAVDEDAESDHARAAKSAATSATLRPRASGRS
eukprot:CAMPEP_0117515894 /NCGR_PEP_ID=MMETSP0784-20121206/30814_1 /TAXON_ID=39447 /ORGANISM="" /LENGTH=69 /DNA_ID=CAMNT_0005311723 /DNA_START=181 /DNA_END=387 /DNA_ORIENTATION=-